MATRSTARLLLTGVGASLLSLVLPAGVRAQPPQAEEQEQEQEQEPEPEVVEPVTPPTVLERVQPKWPEGEAAPDAGEAPVRVRLLATVEASGELGPVEVADSAGPAFDAAALEALAVWRFAPAQRGDEAVPVRVPVVMVFRLRRCPGFTSRWARYSPRAPSRSPPRPAARGGASARRARAAAPR